MITPTPRKLRELLALLLLNANRVVVADDLVEQMWNSAPPRTAKTALQVYICRLRRHLSVHEGSAERDASTRLVTAPSGYILAVQEHELDLARFEALCSAARRAECAGDIERASLLFGRALGLWRGPALADITGPAELNAEAGRLNEARLAAQEQHIAMDLLLGRYGTTIPRLTELIKRQPLREGLHEQLMIAQYHCGRTAEALETYRAVRSALVEELGLEPGARLKSLQQAILNRDPALETRLTPAL
nr:AfsR/SARP family transcriptional regulator [Streptomyces boncukensis]